jgi:hypothetical protein
MPLCAFADSLIPDHGGLDGLGEQLVDQLCTANVPRDDRMVQAFAGGAAALFRPAAEPKEIPPP